LETNGKKKNSEKLARRKAEDPPPRWEGLALISNMEKKKHPSAKRPAKGPILGKRKGAHFSTRKPHSHVRRI